MSDKVTDGVLATEPQEANGSGPKSGSMSGSGSDSGDESDASEQVETLIAGRDRRATAGNRMTNLIEREEDDEVSLLFAQEDEEEDVEFEGSDEDASDAQLDSSSDDEDQGPNTKGHDDLEGEQELQRAAKVQKAKKRKAQDAFTTVSGLKKKVKIDPSITSFAAPSPWPKKKKSERLSWVPSASDGPTRASARKQTVENKEVTHARLQDHAVKRAKQIAQTRKTAHEREKNKPREMTQDERLVEAARTEKKNSKSLNRWEETERKRADEQAAKLAALKNRKLDGPVASWWSGKAKWSGTKLIKIGSKETNQEMLAEPKKKGRKPKQNPEGPDSVKEDAHSSISTPRDQTATPAPSEPSLQQQLVVPESLTQPEQPADPAQATSQITFAAPQGPDNFFLQGIQEYASMHSEAGSNVPSIAPSDGPGTPQISVDSSQRLPTQIQLQFAPPEVTYSTRNLVMLANFENIPASERGEFGVFYNTRKGPKLYKVNQELCPITSLPARYRDPTTGIAYANSDAYRKLKELRDYKFVWSSMLGCYVGKAGVVARGVPDGFLPATAASTTAA